jgi:hypothetical protein
MSAVIPPSLVALPGLQRSPETLVALLDDRSPTPLRTAGCTLLRV